MTAAARRTGSSSGHKRRWAPEEANDHRHTGEDTGEDQQEQEEGEPRREEFNHHDEHLMNDADEEDERHHLIGSDQIAKTSTNRASHLHQFSRNKQAEHTSASLHADMRGRNLLERLAGFLVPRGGGGGGTGPGGTSSRHTRNLDDISTSDFVYQPSAVYSDHHGKSMHANKHLQGKRTDYDDGEDDEEEEERLPAFYYEPTRHRSHNSRPLLMLLVFLLLLLSSCLLLMRLLGLVQDERGRLALDGSRNASLRRQESVLSELSERLDESHRKQLEVERLSRWLVSSSKCHIPVLEPWHESISGYVRQKPPMNCTKLIEDELRDRAHDEEEKSKKHLGSRKRSHVQRHLDFSTKSLTFVRDNKLFFTTKALELGALAVPRGLALESHTHQGKAAAAALAPCCFRRVSRTVENDDELEYSDECTPIRRQGEQINNSIIELTCAAWNYTNVHSFTVHNEEEEQALKVVASSKLNEADHYNVLMVGVDTISRLNGQRQLNRTLALLSDLYESLDFVGYNKVGENTFPNLIPLLTGLKPEQLTETQCWLAKNYTQENERGDDYLDNCKYLWNYYQQVGYMTYFSEDWPAASTFNYLKPGFRNEPTTFYGRPFTLARDKLLWPKFKSIGCASCQLDKPIVEIDLQNLKSFIENNNNKLPYFAFHWINCPQHDDLNGASQVDFILERFFKDLYKTAQDERTFVIFFSDHGYRWNDFVSTRIGHYESSLPMLTIAPPKHFIKNHPEAYENLRRHQDALITPFDMFKTLVDLRNMSAKPSAVGGATSRQMRPPPAESVVMRKRRQQPYGSTLTLLDVASTYSSSPDSFPTTTYPTASTSIAEVKVEDGTTFKQKFTTLSMFEAHSRDQLDRSCIEAGIPDNYCVCQQFQPIEADRLEVLGAAYYLVYVHLETRLRNHKQICHELELEKVHHAEIYNFEQSPTSEPKTASRRRKRQVVKDLNNVQIRKTSPEPASLREPDDNSTTTEDNKHNYLPNREYSIMFSTRPGSGLFQEVVRFYGDDMAKCEAQIDKARKVIEDEWAEFEDKRQSVGNMNSVCEFSVHSESLSRFNLYKDQSKCVKSNIELKKICYCNDLIKKG